MLVSLADAADRVRSIASFTRSQGVVAGIDSMAN